MGCQPLTIEQASDSLSESLALRALQNRYPETPFLALGQTALWDEPTKAALRLQLDTVWPEARLIAATHDSDYFAKLPGHSSPEGHKFTLVPHDDAKTRGLWSAAGEMSRLFGSEDVPTGQRLEREAGVSLHRALQFSEAPVEQLSELTTAWGWTGIIYTEWDKKIAHDISLAEILPVLQEQIAWATGGSMETLGQAGSNPVESKILGWVTEFAQDQPHATLSDLYTHLLPRFYELLLGYAPATLSTSHTLELLRFNTETAGRPRFALADLFVNPKTRPAASAAYDLAVAGSDIYTLAEFNEGATPLELVIPGRGRGTLRFPGRRRVVIDIGQEPLELAAPSDLTNVHQLATLIENELGSEVALVGKAVSLLPMLLAEHILVFHEGASGYSGCSQQFVAFLRERGLALPEIKPILRVKYHTWNALAAVPPENDGYFHLPGHLKQAFGRDRIQFSDFAYCWQNGVTWEKARLQELRGLRSPRTLLNYLIRTEGDQWHAPCEEYEVAVEKLLELRAIGAELRAQEKTLNERIFTWKREVVALEREKGDDFRARVQPLREALLDGEGDPVALDAEIVRLQIERDARFSVPIAERLEQIRDAKAESRRLKRDRKALEWGNETRAARETLRRIECCAEQAKARQARNALQTIYGLPHTNYRPSSWWFPLVDPSGAWFRRVAATAEYYLEPMDVQEQLS